LLRIVEAREKIYRATYEWVLANRVDPTLIQRFIDLSLERIPQDFHDVGDNGDISDPDEGWAHAAVLAQYLRANCAQRFRPHPI
jgi:hypothetical protein